MRPDEPVALREAVAILSALTGREAAALPLSGGAGVTRAEGVALVNRALGRSPDVEAASQWLTPLFDDVPWGHPAYFELMEAAVGHTAAGGRWLDYERELPAAGFNLVGTELYYADPATLEPLRGGYVGSLVLRRGRALHQRRRAAGRICESHPRGAPGARHGPLGGPARGL